MQRSNRLGTALDFAETHHHLLTTAAMRGAGLTYDQISDLHRDRVIERIIRGLYRQRGTRTPLQDIAAAVIRHESAAASSASALFVHRFDITPPRRPIFTLPPGCTGSTTLGSLHRSPLDRIDVTRRQGIAVTTVPRSVVDAAEVLDADALGDVVAQAIARQMTTIAAIEECASRLERAPGRIGSGRLRTVLAGWTDAIRPDSVAEAAVLRRIRGFGLPVPATQHVISDVDGEFLARVDLAWPDEMVAREYDSPRYHAPPRTEADELRMQRLESLGWQIDGVNRTHLSPGNVGWLRALREVLEARRPSAAS